MTAYSMDLPQRVLADCDAGLDPKVVAEKYAVSPTWFRALRQRRRETGEIAARRGHVGRKPKIDHARLAELVRADLDPTLAERRARFGVRCALPATWKALDQLRFAFKKKGRGLLLTLRLRHGAQLKPR